MTKTITLMQRMLLALAVLFAAMPASAYDFKAENEDGVTIYYKASGNEAAVVKGDAEYSGDIVIPEKVTNAGKEYQVTKIGENTFIYSEMITSVCLPATISELPSSCFDGCSSLSSVTLPSTLKAIPLGTFGGCISLKAITIPTSVTFIGSLAFSGCTALNTINIPESVTTIATQAFANCSKLATITLPNSLKTIADGVFFNCNNILSIYSNIEVPETVNIFPSTIFKTATLYVPQGTKVAYASTSGWGFAKIVEMQEVTNITLTAADVTLRKGEQAKLTFSMNNGETGIIGFQFDLTLPEGISISGMEDHGRCAGFRLKTSKEPINGKRTVVCYCEDTESTKTVTGSEGPLFTLLLEAGENLKEGQLQGVIDNVTLVKEDHTKVYPAESTFSITIDNPLMGDVNGDGIVSVDDITRIVDYIIYKKVEGTFDANAADMDKDGVIDVADITLVVKAIMEQQPSNARQLANAMQTDDVLTLQELGDGNFAVSLNNRYGYMASQFDIKVATGTTITAMTLDADRCPDHTLSYQQVADTIYRVIIYSPGNQLYEGSDGTLLTFKASGATTGMAIDESLFVDASHQKTFFGRVPVTTGIASVTNEHTSPTRIYTLGGRQLPNDSPLKKGVYIIDGKKIVK